MKTKTFSYLPNIILGNLFFLCFFLCFFLLPNYSNAATPSEFPPDVIVNNDLEVDQIPELEISGEHEHSTCPGNTGSIKLTVTGGVPPYSYLWTNGATTANIFNLAAGDYTVTVTDSYGAIARHFFRITSISDIEISGEHQHSTCPNNTGSINLTVNGGTQPYSYLWTNGAMTPTINNLAAGDYTVTVTDNNGCTAAHFFRIESISDIEISGEHEHATCPNNTGSIRLTVSGGSAPYSYSWTNGATTSTINNLAAGDYTVTVTDNNGCTATHFFRIESISNIEISGEHQHSTCPGSTGSIRLNVGGGSAPYTYLWTNGATTSDINNIPGGDYTVTVTDYSGCTATHFFRIESISNIEISGEHQHSACPENTGSINLSVNGGTAPYSYLWTNGATTANLNNIPGGGYTVTVTDILGCTATHFFRILEFSEIEISGEHQHTCPGSNNGSIDITVTGGHPPYNFLWSNGATTEDINNLAAGDYTVTVTDNNGCTATHFFRITNAEIKISGEHKHPSCLGNNNGSIELTVNGGTQPYSYLWTNGATTSDINNLAAGDYTVTVTDNNGCTATHFFRIIIPGAADCEDFTYDAFWRDNGTSSNTNVTLVSGISGTISVLLDGKCIPDELIVTINGIVVLELSAGFATCDGSNSCNGDFSFACAEFCVEPCDLVNLRMFNDICHHNCLSNRTAWDLFVTCEEKICGEKETARQVVELENRSSSSKATEEYNPENRAMKNMKVFPNPVTDVLNITNTDPKISYQTLRIINSVGKVVHTENRSGLYKLQVDVNAFPKGIYIIEMTDDYGHRVVEKFMKMEGSNSF